jgi:ribosomal protein S18 acetylase RimI-like enzyme
LTPADIDTFRLAEPSDTNGILALVNTDRLPGQPQATAEMLTEALSGRSALGSGLWTELDGLSTEVAINTQGQVVGVVSVAVRRRDDTGLILWMHTAEDAAVTGIVLDHALQRLGRRPVEAFPLATALGLGLEALPIKHRPVTHAALLQRGFTGTDLWRYLRTPLRLPSRQTKDGPAQDVRRTLQIRENDRVVGEAIVGLPVQGVGVLWWIGLEPQARELELDKALLGSALEFLAGVGAGEVILFVPSADAADPTVLGLYRHAGFTEIDQLYGFRRPKP